MCIVHNISREGECLYTCTNVLCYVTPVNYQDLIMDDRIIDEL